MKKLVWVFLFAILILLGSYTDAKAGKTFSASRHFYGSGQIKNDNNTIEITISAIGDCTLGEDKSLNEHTDFTEEFIMQRRDYGFFFKNVEPILKKDDITIANLETTLTNATERAKKKFRFKGDPSYTKILKTGSVDVVNIANNHIYDYLNKGFKDTVTFLKEDGIGICGYGYKHVESVKGVKVGFLGYTGWDNSSKFKSIVKRDINELKKSCSIVVVSFHWGNEYTNYPDSVQKSLGRYSIDCGADLILGHHPHVIQGIETYKGKKIVYSLGNFVFGGNVTPRDYDSFIYQQTFKFDKDKKLIDAAKINIIPCVISTVKGRNNYQPVVLSGNEAARVTGRIEKYSRGIK